MPELVRLYIRQVAIGFAISAAFVAMLIGLDVAGLRGLIWRSPDGWLAVFLLFFFNGLVFAGVQFAISVMAMAEPSSGGNTPGRRLVDWLARAQSDRIPQGAAPVQVPGRTAHPDGANDRHTPHG